MSFPDRRTADALLTILVFALALWIVYVARHVIVIFAFAILFAYLIDPVVRFLQRHSLFFRDLRGPHIAEAYILFLVLVALLVHALAPGLVRDRGRFFQQVPNSVDRIATGEIARDIGTKYGWDEAREVRLKNFLAEHEGSIRGMAATVAVAGTTVLSAVFLVPILALFFLSGGAAMTRSVIQFLCSGERAEAMHSLAAEIDVMLRNYIRAKVILGVCSLVFYAVAMLLMGFPHAIVLGVVGGILEFIPVVGWMIAAVLFLTIGSLAHAHWIWMALLLALWRMTMDYLISPRVVGKNLEIHPLVVILAVMVGGAVGGIVGVYLSIPVIAVAKVIWERRVLASGNS